MREFVVEPDHVVHPDTPPLEIVLLLYQGANNIPVVDRGTGRLVGMVVGARRAGRAAAREGS